MKTEKPLSEKAESPAVQKKNLKRRRLIIAGILVLPVMYFVIFSNRGVLTRLQLDGKKREVQEKIHQEQMRKDSLRTYIQRLKNDSTLIEQLARERYGMIKSGETVYTIETK